MAQHYEDWSGYSGGDDPTVDGEAGCTERWHASSVSYQVLDDVTSPTGKVLRVTTGGSNNRALLSLNAIDSDPDRATAKVRALIRINTVASNSTVLGLGARASGGTTSETGAVMAAGLSGSSSEQVRTFSYNNASPTSSQNAGSNAWSTGNFFWVALDVDGTSNTGSIRTEANPSTIVNSTSETTPITAAGWIGLFSFSDGNTIDVAKITVATGTDDEFFDEPASDTTAPVLTSPTDDANGSTASTGSVTTDEGNGTLYWVVTTSATAPSVAQIQAGQDHTGAAAAASGSQAVTAAGVQNITPSGLSASTQYYTHYQHQDAATNDSTVSSADGFTTSSGDVTAPILSSATGTEVSATSADLSVSTDEDNGTLYWVVTTSATKPSVAQVQAGQDHTGTAAAASGNQAVSATGAQNATATGLTSKITFYAHFQQADTATNDSAVVTSSAFAPYPETVGLTDDFDSALGQVGTITNPFTASPTITLTPENHGDVQGWQQGFWKVDGLEDKSPTFNLDCSNVRNLGEKFVSPHVAIWRTEDNVTVPADGRPRDFTAFDTNSGTSAYVFSHSVAFAADTIEIAFFPRWRYLDTQRAFAYAATSSYASELPSSISHGSPQHVHAQIAFTGTPENQAAPTTLDYHCLKLDDTASQPAGGEDKLNVVMVYSQHASEDTGDFAFWEMVYQYTDGVGTIPDWFRQHCRLYLYDVNNAGRYYGKERYTEEDGGDEDSNREWETAGGTSTQVNAVITAILADVPRIDCFFDFHVLYTLNGNGRGVELGNYVRGTEGTNYQIRLNSLLTQTVDTLGTTATAGVAKDWAYDEQGAQLAITYEFPAALDTGYPTQEAQLTGLMGSYVEAVKLMVENGELSLYIGVVEAAVMFGVTVDDAQAGGAVAEANVADSVLVTLDTGGQATMEAHITPGVQVGYLGLADAVAQGFVLSGVQAGANASAIAIADARITERVLAGEQVNAQAQSGVSIEAAVAFAVSAGTSAIADAVVEAAIEFNAQMSSQAVADAQADAAVLIDAEIATNAIAEALAEANITAAAISNVSFTGTSISGDAVTPDGRIYKVTADLRVFTVTLENRTYTVH